jgi:hypothetical protein
MADVRHKVTDARPVVGSSARSNHLATLKYVLILVRADNCRRAASLHLSSVGHALRGWYMVTHIATQQFRFLDE